MTENRASDWWRQAQNDLKFARAALRGKPEVVWAQPAPLTRAQLVAKLRRRLRACAREAYLFGSYARDQASVDSDVDLIIVADSTRSFPDRFRDFVGLGDGLPPMDLLIYTPAEWRKLRAQPPPLLRVAMAEWIALRS